MIKISFDVNGIQNKEQLASLAKARQNASAILNAPTVADFKSSTNPSFTDANGIFKVAYIATGGNLDKNPTSLYSLPGINGGANYAFYYGPGLLVSDNGKDLIVPPAAYISNNFIDKYTSASPWSIVAGPRRGVVGGNGVKGTEYSFDKSDRDVLEPFGINPVVFQRGVGLTILGNKTAQQSAHVREALIYIQEGIAAILKDYVFEFNNTQTRLEIKTLADSFMESVKADGGVYAFKNTMDQTNNTDDVIDNNIGVIDTYVEPVKGLEIVVHRTTILNTGEIETGNFN
ncbi:phage tail sheath C-terminal domain-containing protein [uncultured Winogradskyella sp.]|uniref:phage tail sheath C-terminal domain-containing protein n=1 Tax=uncultured Winogradskyella sp. TaxID=395353 RepID=UPI0030EC6E6A